jgi:UDP-N-acetylglucosamine--N-acetylmuramyl-(pentapeptide) pyrophosphoryl-undecaprenol N-acetylglucosamine transferase
MKKEIKVIFTGGGSGGHTMPAISMINSLKEYCTKNNILCTILYIGSENGIEKEVVLKNKVDYKYISTGKLRRYLSLKNFTDIFNIINGFFQSRKIIKEFNPDLLFSTGGFVSVPPVVGAKFAKVPVIIHEQTIDAGLANKIAGHFAGKICLTFSESKKFFPAKKVVVTGIPLREEIFSGNVDSAKKRFGFDFEKPVLFFYGGGLGCHKLNVVGLQIIEKLLDKCNVIFQTGKSNGSKDFLELKKLCENLPEEKKRRFQVYDFINEEISDIYKIATLVIARSGAGTVCELTSLKIPAIFIPLAIATRNEQYKNASIMKNAGSAVIIEEKDLTAERLNLEIENILFTDGLKKMKENFSKIENPDGKQKILEMMISFFK